MSDLFLGAITIDLLLIFSCIYICIIVINIHHNQSNFNSYSNYPPTLLLLISNSSLISTSRSKIYSLRPISVFFIYYFICIYDSIYSTFTWFLPANRQTARSSRKILFRRYLHSDLSNSYRRFRMTTVKNYPHKFSIRFERTFLQISICLQREQTIHRLNESIITFLTDNSEKSVRQEKTEQARLIVFELSTLISPSMHSSSQRQQIEILRNCLMILGQSFFLIISSLAGIFILNLNFSQSFVGWFCRYTYNSLWIVLLVCQPSITLSISSKFDILSNRYILSSKSSVAIFLLSSNRSGKGTVYGLKKNNYSASSSRFLNTL